MFHVFFCVAYGFLSISNSVVFAWFPEQYPIYCNKNTMSRKIPSLTESQAQLVNNLEQVQAIIRHGARTPYTNYQCWKGYNISWNNCNITELMLASPSYTDPDRPATWLFRKLYDGSSNYLGGNCYTGQLISEGYTQEEANGQYLYEAYFNSTFKLFETNSWTDIDTDSLIYLRSDDAQRTLMSGQILLHSMFNITEEIIVPWHTGDYGLDQIYPNSDVCPKISALETSIFNTPSYLSFNNSKQVQQLEQDLNKILGEGYWFWDYIFDCFMTTVCTGRPLPDGDPSTGVVMNQQIFNATIFAEEFSNSYLNLYNNSQWAKLSLGNIAWHLKTNIQNIVNNSTKDNTHPYKFVLFSGHDNTVQPLLSAIAQKNWDQLWPGYASMITIEIYNASESSISEYLFRIVYNSKALIIPGCSDSLCDINVLLNAMAFAEEDMPCSVSSDTTSSEIVCGDDDGSSISNTDWAFIIVLSSLLGGLIGAGIVVFFNKHYFNKEINKPLLRDTESGEQQM